MTPNYRTLQREELSLSHTEILNAIIFYIFIPNVKNKTNNHKANNPDAIILIINKVLVQMDLRKKRENKNN